MRKFSYWMPGGITGDIEAESPYYAAKTILLEKPIYCGYTQPYHYIGQSGYQEIHIHEIFEKEN